MPGGALWTTPPRSDLAREHGVLGEAPVIARGDADEPLRIAEVVEAHAAIPAAAAVDVRCDGQQLADLVVADLRPDGRHDPGELVTGHDTTRRVRALLPAPQVRAADATGANGEQDTVGGQDRIGHVHELDALRGGDVGCLHDACSPRSRMPTAPPGCVSPNSSRL